jgi:hypothetical protein
MNPIKIEVREEAGGYRLYTLSAVTGSLPAGPRLFRLNPPAIEFFHTNKIAAAKDAEKLQLYLSQVSKKEERKQRNARIID